MSKKADAKVDDAIEAALTDATKQAELAAAIERLSPEEAAYFLFQIEIKLRARKIQLLGYLVGIGVWLVGMFFSLVYYGLAKGFAGWAFLVPFAMFGAILYIFGRWSNKIAATKPPPELVGKG